MNAEEEPQEDLATQSEEVGYSRRTFGLSLFFLVSAAAVLVVWWLALRSPVALTKLYKHYVDIDTLAESINIGFIAMMSVCFTLGFSLLILAIFQARRRKVPRL